MNTFCHLKLNKRKNGFILEVGPNQYDYPGTVGGAQKIVEFLGNESAVFTVSSDLFHPEEFPMIEEAAFKIFQEEL